MIEFPSMKDATACFESEEYQSAAAFRRDGSGEVENVIIEATEGFGTWPTSTKQGFFNAMLISEHLSLKKVF